MINLSVLTEIKIRIDKTTDTLYGKIHSQVKQKVTYSYSVD